MRGLFPVYRIDDVGKVCNLSKHVVTRRTIFEKNISNENDGHLVSSLLPINEYSMQSSGKSKRVTFRGA